MLPFILISLIPAISLFSIWARLTMSTPIVALLYVSYTVWLLFRAFLSFLMFHDSLAHWFWNVVSSIFFLFYIQLLPVLDVCFMCQFGCIWALSSLSEICGQNLRNVGQNSCCNDITSIHWTQRLLPTYLRFWPHFSERHIYQHWMIMTVGRDNLYTSVHND